MLIALTSLKGSPGVTTLTGLLAAQWPAAAVTRRLIVEVDPAGGDLAMRFGLASTPGLVSLAAAARRSSDPDVTWEHTQGLPGGARVVVAPPAAVLAQSAVHTLATAPHGPLLDATAHEPGVVVLADCGRIDPGSPAEMIARRADALVLVTVAHGDGLAHVAARLRELAHWTPRPGLLLTGSGYPTPDVERELGVPTIGRIPHDPTTAAALSGHRAPKRRRSSGLTRSAATLARALAKEPAPQKRPPNSTDPPQPAPALYVTAHGNNGHQPLDPGKDPQP